MTFSLCLPANNMYGFFYGFVFIWKVHKISAHKLNSILFFSNYYFIQRNPTSKWKHFSIKWKKNELQWFSILFTQIFARLKIFFGFEFQIFSLKRFAGFALVTVNFACFKSFIYSFLYLYILFEIFLNKRSCIR